VENSIRPSSCCRNLWARELKGLEVMSRKREVRISGFRSGEVLGEHKVVRDTCGMDK
jgi:hypothetical protein